MISGLPSAKTGLYQGLSMSLEDVLNTEVRNQAIALRAPDPRGRCRRLPREAAAALHGPSLARLITPL